MTSNGAAALPSYQAFPSLGTSPIQYTKITLSSSDITGMYVTPKLLVSAGGANTLLVVLGAVWERKYNSVAYTGGGVIYVQWDSTTLGAGTAASVTATAANVTGTTDTFRMIAGTSVPNLGALTTVNKGLYLSNGTGSFATGNSTCYLHLYYALLVTTI